MITDNDKNDDPEDSEIQVIDGFLKYLFDIFRFFSLCISLPYQRGKKLEPLPAIVKKKCFKQLKRWNFQDIGLFVCKQTAWVVLVV